MIIPFIYSFLLLSSGNDTIIEECEYGSFINACEQRLIDYTFVKDHMFLKAYIVNTEVLKREGENGKIEYPYLFSKGTDYKLVVCDGQYNECRIIVSIYDKRHKLIASNYDEKTGRWYYSGIRYMCKSSGIYYINFTFYGEGKGCGAGVLGFR